MHTISYLPRQAAMSPNERYHDPGATDVRPDNADRPTAGDTVHSSHETSGHQIKEEFDNYERQGMPPLAEHTLTDTHSCARLLADFSEQLVVAHTPGTEIQSVLYVVDPATGLVSCNRGQTLALSMHVADQIVADYKKWSSEIPSAEGQCPGSEDLPPLPSKLAVISHARALRSARAPDLHQKVIGGVLEHDLRTGGILASKLTVRPHASLDLDMSVIGTLNGILDVRTLRILQPADAATRFISRSTGVEYYQKAQDPRVDRILPPPSEVDHQSRIGFIMRWIGWHITRPPKRDFLGLISEGNAGKTTLVNTVLAGLGDYANVIRSEALGGGQDSSNPGSHNDDLLRFGGGRRLVFVMEARCHNKEVLNLVTGGDPMTTRPIRRAVVEFPTTAGLAIIGNTPGTGQSSGAVLGIGGDDEVSASLRDRIRIVRLPRRGDGEGIPEDATELAVAANRTWWTTDFRQAALARILEWAVVMIDQQDPPEPTDEMVADQAIQESAERLSWQMGFISRILTTDPKSAILEGAGAGQSLHRAADSYSVYQEYLRWHQANGVTGSPLHRRAVTDALFLHYRGLKGVAREGKIPVGDRSQRPKTVYFDGYYICDLGVDGI